MLLVISHPKLLENEHEIIHALFNEGLQRFHLRKPNSSTNELKKLMQKVDKKYHSQISTHDAELAKTVDEIGVHAKSVQAFSNKVCSTSTHSIEEWNALSEQVSYAFLSPVFDSISKPGYSAKQFDWRKRKTKSTKLIALGGITAENCNSLKGKVDGIAVLGTVWENENPIQAYKKTQEAWTTSDQ